MKKNLLLFVSLCLATAGMAQDNAGDDEQAVAYYAVAQSHYVNGQISAEGGDVKAYQVGVSIDGDAVTLTNLMNGEATGSPDNPITGTYDADAKTITIPTSTVFEDATIVGTLWSYYKLVLVSGEVGADGSLTAAPELVLNVEGDFERITSTQSMGMLMYSPDGTQVYGSREMYRSFTAYQPSEDAHLMAFSTGIDFGSSFPGNSVERKFTVVNTGGGEADYVIDIEADDDVFSVSQATGQLSGQSMNELTFTFSGTQTGDYEGIATITYEAANGEDNLLLQLNGEVKDYPDYQQIVRQGSFTFASGNDYPFVLDEVDGQTVATSTTQGFGGVTSYLDVTMDVPEGELGTFSWKGVSNNSSAAYTNAGIIIVDGNELTNVNQPMVDISGDVLLAPGRHTVTFKHAGYYFSGVEDNRLYVYDLSLTTETMQDDEAELRTPEYDFRNFIVDEEHPADATCTLILLNKGRNPLHISGATSTNDAFTIDTDLADVATMEQLSIPVSFATTQPGLYEATITLNTSAGDFQAEVKANAIAMPDFQSIVKAGDFTFETDPNNPFIVADGKAYNASSQQPDYEPLSTTLKASFSIPEGKIGYIYWKGHSYGSEPKGNVGFTSDYSSFHIQHPKTGSYKNLIGDVDASSDAVFDTENNKQYQACVPGDHFIEFTYNQIGDTACVGLDRLEIYDLELQIFDYNEHEARLEQDTLQFDSIYVGQNRWTFSQVKIRNIGSQPLVVDSISDAGPFHGYVPNGSAQYNQTLNIDLYFYPDEPGMYADTLSIFTNAGELRLPVSGYGKSTDGILLVGDFEDDALGWQVYDADGDGQNWALGTVIFGRYYPQFAHGGVQFMGSASYSNYYGNLKPDNWLFSPAVTIPTEGATLTWAAAAHYTQRPEETYDLYIATAPEEGEPIDVTGLDQLESVFTETLTQDFVSDYAEHSLDLSPWAGQTVNICFRHHDCEGQWVLRLDDVFVWPATVATAIAQPQATEAQTVTRQEIYSLSGIRQERLEPGVNIVRSYHADGTVSTEKISIR